MQNVNLPPLAHYRSIHDYQPRYGDYVLWSGWMTTWHGFVVHHDKQTDEISIIFAGVPYLLVTMDDKEHERNTKKIPLRKIVDSMKGSWAILRDEKEHGCNIWYI